MEKFKVIIAGGRDFTNYQMVEDHCDRILKNKENIEIVSGGATGVDALAETYSVKKGFQFIKFSANWKEYGKAAGPIRNRQMAKYADALIAFWNGQSRGTKNMIELAAKESLKTRIIYI